jgi:His/Glu/Gln/Arg/opine family amino acid ABC transporter permease subunit
MNIIDVVINYGSVMVNAFKLILILSFTSFSLGFLGGIALITLNLTLPRFLKMFLRIFVEIIRGTPTAVQLFFIYYVLPVLGIKLDPFTSALLALSINSSVYQSEYLRAALNSIPRTQWEASLSLGFTRLGSWFYIMMPQVLRIAIPALTNELIYITKFSSIAYFVTLPELVYVSEVIGAKTFAYTEVYIVAACLYIAVAFVISEFMEYLYKKLSIQGLTMM